MIRGSNTKPHSAPSALPLCSKFMKMTSVSHPNEESKNQSSSSGLKDNRHELTISSLDTTQMLYIDDFFFMLGNSCNASDQSEYLFMVKGSEIKDHFKLHTKTLAIKKINIKEEKLIVSLGYDTIPEEGKTGDIDVVGAAGRRRCIKVWSYSSLIMGEYNDYVQAGITGGFEPSMSSPRIIELEDNVDSPPMDFLDVSACGQYIGVVSSRERITIHKAYPNFSIPPDKAIKSREIKVTLRKSSSQILSCHFYRDRISNINYVYIVASDMIYLIDTEKKVSETMELTMNEVEVIPS